MRNENINGPSIFDKANTCNFDEFATLLQSLPLCENLILYKDESMIVINYSRALDFSIVFKGSSTGDSLIYILLI